jgi:hypothetical protein
MVSTAIMSSFFACHAANDGNVIHHPSQRATPIMPLFWL